MISFLTFLSQDIEKAVQVFECLDLRFHEEKHGNGPVHFACENDGLTIEIYPGLEVNHRSMMIGFAVPDLHDVQQKLLGLGVEIIKETAVVGGMRRFIARDFDGRDLFVHERK